MSVTITTQLKTLQGMSVAQLRAKYRELFDEETTSHHRDYLFKRIAWRLQEQALGGLSQRAQDRLTTLVDETQIRARPPKGFTPAVDVGTPAAPEPPANKIITRLYKGRQIDVEVLDQGFLYDGTMYASLSAVAKAVTGNHCSGRAFFGLSGKE